RHFRSYSPGLVPGLLQTREYTEAVLRAVRRRRVEVDDVADAVEARMARQHVLSSGQRRFAFLVEEAVLRNAPCGPAVLAEQLDRLVEIGSRPHISLGVLPTAPDRSRMPVEGFWIYDTEQVNVELVSGYLTITQASEITMYAQAFMQLSASAVYGADARAHITAARGALRRGCDRDGSP
ncbi:DUF5753 domain-containing protein, partial [Streptomyces sp. NPDC002454]